MKKFQKDGCGDGSEQHREDLAAALGEVKQHLLDCLSPAIGGTSFQEVAERAIEMPQVLTVATGHPRSRLVKFYRIIGAATRWPNDIEYS